VYDGIGRLTGLGVVEDWLAVISNYNKAASVWNSFQNGVSVKLLEEKTV